MPAGAVVAAWNRGSAFRVEFARLDTLAIVDGAGLRRATRAMRRDAIAGVPT